MKYHIRLTVDSHFEFRLTVDSQFEPPATVDYWRIVDCRLRGLASNAGQPHTAAHTMPRTAALPDKAVRSAAHCHTLHKFECCTPHTAHHTQPHTAIHMNSNDDMWMCMHLHEIMWLCANLYEFVWIKTVLFECSWIKMNINIILFYFISHYLICFEFMQI